MYGQGGNIYKQNKGIISISISSGGGEAYVGLRGSHKGYLGGNIPNWLILYLHVNGPCGNSTLPTCHLHILND